MDLEVEARVDEPMISDHQRNRMIQQSPGGEAESLDVTALSHHPKGGKP